MSDTNKFFGKYRGTVINNIDPEQRGRIQVMVPDVTGFLPSTWAMPALPIGGLPMGMFSVPVIGSGVWVEFEQGDIDYPIWVGVYWGSAAEVPALSHLIPRCAWLRDADTLAKRNRDQRRARSHRRHHADHGYRRHDPDQ